MIQLASNSECSMSNPQQASGELRRRVSADTIIRCAESLARRTTLRVGGPADLYVEPASTVDLSTVVGFCAEQGLPWLILGRGSNVLVNDQGYRGMVICLAQPHFSQIEVAGEHLSCGAGARLKAVAIEARRHALTGLEFLEGIPGSLGGGLRMNAGAMGSALFDLVESVRLMDPTGRVEERTRSDLQVQYRSCSTLRNYIALGAVLHGRPGSSEEIQQRMNEFSRKRWNSQPAAPSAGCIFKNPPSIPAGKLIDELGLKGTRVGGAVISAEHGNFIVTDGHASSQDVLDLIELIRTQALKQRGILLETEVQIIGD